MHFKEFSEYLSKIENTAGRTDMTKLLAEFLGKVKGDEIKYSMYLLQGRLAPKFVPLEFNASQKLILKALGQMVNDEPDVVKMYKVLGDTGSVAEELKMKNEELRIDNPRELSIKEVYEKLKELADIAGKGSVEGKLGKYKDLIIHLDSLSAKYVTRMIVGTLRLGISDKTILDAISWHKVGDKSIRGKLDIAFGVRADIGELARIVLESSRKSGQASDITEILNKMKVEPGTAIASKLVEREANSKAVWQRMPNCFVQPKLDGLRGQIHFCKTGFVDNVGDAAIFSRNMETMTDQFPEILDSVRNLGVDSIILDSEIIGFDDKTESYRTYQDTMKRRRKYDVDSYSQDIPVKAMCFDILYLNGKDLTLEPIEKRLELLEEIVGPKSKVEVSKIPALRMLETKQMQTEEELEEYFKDKVENGLEGIITKQTGTTYDPGTRNFKWIKLKANTRSDLVDTIDVVVMGYYGGRGDRARFGFGTLLAGVYDPKEDKYYSIGKVGSGFTEEMMEKMFKEMQKIKTKDNQIPESYIVDKTLYPDVWLEPKIIMEIIADEITRSPNHTAAIGLKANVKGDDPTKGLSIRFPRMKIWNREDKDYPNAVTEIVRMYELRKGS